MCFLSFFISQCNFLVLLLKKTKSSSLKIKRVFKGETQSVWVNKAHWVWSGTRWCIVTVTYKERSGGPSLEVKSPQGLGAIFLTPPTGSGSGPSVESEWTESREDDGLSSSCFWSFYFEETSDCGLVVFPRWFFTDSFFSGFCSTGGGGVGFYPLIFIFFIFWIIFHSCKVCFWNVALTPVVF